ncbi:MAG: undecaprenyl-diphosphate phosphatase [Candidatus Latescibacterota bacterium]
MTPFEAMLLGLVQGLTEFLPVSSSGHLVLARTFLGVSGDGITFEVMVHFGTFLAILTVFFGQIQKMIVGVSGGIGVLFARKGIARRFREDEHLRLAVWIGIGSIPAGCLGLLFEEAVEQAFASPILVSGALVVTGGMLFSTRYVKESSGKVGFGEAVLIGIAQALAIIPGISRSGATIVTGFWRKVDRAQAAEFSFLLALPVIFGATVLKLKDVFLAPPSSAEGWALVVGTATAYGSGYLAIRMLLGIVRKGRLDRFAYYCWAVGFFGLILQVVK